MPATRTAVVAADAMSTPAVAVAESVSLGAAARIMTERNIGCLPVVDADGKLVGMLTERMFQALLAGGRPVNSLPFAQRTVLELYSGRPRGINVTEQGLRELTARPVKSVMFREPAVVGPGTPLWAVADRMLQAHVSHIAVVSEGRPVGVIARHDLLKTMAAGN